MQYNVTVVAHMAHGLPLLIYFVCSNGWKLPETPGCTFFVHPNQGWPKEDFDLIGNEASIPSGKVENLYRPRNEFVENKEGRWTVDEVKWVTTLRHPFDRTLSHYKHVTSCKPKYRNLTLESFLTQPQDGGFTDFIPNQQTRWHCGTGPCSDTKHHPICTQQMLNHAIYNLNQMHGIFLLEDMSNPKSCTRRQMKHLFNFKLESFTETNANSTSTAGESLPKRHGQNNWETAVRPFLDSTGQGNNQTALRKFAVNESSILPTTAALALHNDMDLQLYGYARHLCEVMANKYDLELLQQAAAAAAESTPANDMHIKSYTHTTTDNVPGGSALRQTNQPENYLDTSHLFIFFEIQIAMMIVLVARIWKKSCKRSCGTTNTR